MHCVNTEILAFLVIPNPDRKRKLWKSLGLYFRNFQIALLPLALLLTLEKSK